MSTDSDFQSDQEAFWAGAFGSDYIDRNQGEQLLAANLNFFAAALARAGLVGSCVELGANIGMNLRALKLLYPKMRQQGVEINAEAARQLASFVGDGNVFHGTILDWIPAEPSELALIKGVLIHIHPELLPGVYEKLYQASSRFILVAEYYNPSPVVIPYRGHSDRLFKRDFAGEILSRYSDVVLLDYGFVYRRDPAFPQDDITWFLLEKRV